MAHSPANLLRDLRIPAGARRLWVAVSGGLDSSVLLHALCERRHTLGVAIEVAHVDHGLHARAPQWAAQVRGACARLGVACRVCAVDAHARRGESPEAAARTARYAAISRLMTQGDALVTAHQRDDQAETVLLQLLRGGGPAGLAAMPSDAAFGPGWHLRPLLALTRAELRAYAQRWQLSWIEDPGNQALGLDRNFVRHELLPRLRERWPAVTRTLARAAGAQADAAALLAALGERDLAGLEGVHAGTLSVSALVRLPAARQRNALRAWIGACELALPSAVQLEHVRTDVLGARADAQPCVAWPGGQARRYRDALYVMPPLSAHDPSVVYPWAPLESLVIAHLGVRIEREGLRAQGLVIRCDQSDVTVRFRRGGERCKPRGARHRHTLKKLFQQAGVPPWERPRIPLIYIGERLAAVLGYWVCADD